MRLSCAAVIFAILLALRIDLLRYLPAQECAIKLTHRHDIEPALFSAEACDSANRLKYDIANPCVRTRARVHTPPREINFERRTSGNPIFFGRKLTLPERMNTPSSHECNTGVGRSFIVRSDRRSKSYVSIKLIYATNDYATWWNKSRTGLSEIKTRFIVGDNVKIIDINSFMKRTISLRYLKI